MAKPEEEAKLTEAVEVVEAVTNSAEVKKEDLPNGLEVKDVDNIVDDNSKAVDEDSKDVVDDSKEVGEGITETNGKVPKMENSEDKG